MVIEFDDFGANYIISDMCQSHDCRDQLDKFKFLNPNFKVTLFTIPGYMTQEMFNWSEDNRDWVELAVHGFYHTSNYECEKMTFDEFAQNMDTFEDLIEQYFVKGFRAPGWQISTEAMEWLKNHDWWIADQGYNDHRRPEGLKAYVNYDGIFKVGDKEIQAYHGHTWDVGWNGIYEDNDKIEDIVRQTWDFEFVSEVL